MQIFTEQNKNFMERCDDMEQEQKTRQKLHVVIIDSGLNYSSPNVKLEVTIKEENGKKIILDGCQDENGHGTAVYELINQETKDLAIDYSIIKILNEDFVCSYETLVAALAYVNKNLSCDIVHISAGLTLCQDLSLLQSEVDQLYEKGTVVVSAFDNFGAISYPAAFSNVIGVDVTKDYSKKKDYCFVEESVINIRVPDTVYRAHWKDNKKVFLQGNSFGATLVTAKILRILSQDEEVHGFEQVLNKLKEGAYKVYTAQKHKFTIDAKQVAKSIKKAAVFPFNKEVHALAANEQELIFEVVGYYDIKFSQSIGKRIVDMHPHIHNEKIVECYSNIPWDEIDTLVLGHCDELNDLFKADVCKELVQICIEKGKNIYSFSNIINKLEDPKQIEGRIQIGFPFDHKYLLPQYQFGKLYRCGKPVLAVFGTSSKQGKFTLQLQLRKKFQKEFKVGQLSTEPTGYLFGMDEVYPMGYDSTVYLQGTDAVVAVNQKMHQIEQTNPDIIIVGGQSGVVPYALYNVQMLTTQHYEFMLGVQPDAVVLCVNANDDRNFIRKNISFIESIGQSKVVALVVFPQEIKVDALGMRMKKTNLDIEKCNQIREELKQTFNKNTYILGDTQQEDELYEDIISFFTK